MLKIAFIPMSFLHFFAVSYKKYSDLLQVVLQCKKYSKSTAGNGTQRKTVIFTADIFAVHKYFSRKIRGRLFMYSMNIKTKSAMANTPFHQSF
jgi:hypothetical protein